MDERFCPVAYGVDDVTLGFDLEGSASVPRLNARPGVETRRGKMLGERVSWGKWSHLLGRSVSFWKSDTKRLYVQAKLAADGELCPPAEIRARVRELLERMAIVGIESYEDPWVTRLDVAVDAGSHPMDGKLLLDALEAVRLPNGWRTTSVGVPRSTVYFRARVADHVKARAYCRNLKTKHGEPFGLIRLEAEERFKPKACPLELAISPTFLADVWRSRFGRLAAKVTRLGREAQAADLAERQRERPRSDRDSSRRTPGAVRATGRTSCCGIGAASGWASRRAPPRTGWPPAGPVSLLGRPQLKAWTPT
jgi:hypothetical protein